MNAEQALAVLEQAAITQEHAERAVSADGDIEAARRAFQRIASNLSGAQEARAFFADLVDRDALQRNALEHIANTCPGRAAEVARAGLSAPQEPQS